MNNQLCPLCNARKPKRECRFHGDICDSCCGEARDAKCTGCDYYNPPICSLPLYKCMIISGGGMHSIFIAKESPKEGLIFALFLVDTLGEGIKEVDFGKNKTKLDIDNLLNRKTMAGDKAKEVSLEYAKKVIKIGAALNGYALNSSDKWKRCMELIGGLNNTPVDESLMKELNDLEMEDDLEELCPCCGEKLERRPATKEEIFEHFMQHKEDSEQYTSLGMEFEKSNKRAKARMLYERQIELYQDDYGGYFNLGRYMLKRHDYLKAKSLLLTAFGKLAKKEGENHAEVRGWINSVVQKIEEAEKKAETCNSFGKIHWKTRLKFVERED
ncbi:MAG: hypothetical protein QME12_02025 [Nanoarchaeota archaeon]|nr:hypothetical protein [Nanoarchaeota archaeon]